ncbi:MAG TPA: hypothetical protein VM165_20240 [Planctomycetaceae bacterium]|nr:hypothetical protein [Planctomycetaceae bacterium]
MGCHHQHAMQAAIGQAFARLRPDHPVEKPGDVRGRDRQSAELHAERHRQSCLGLSEPLKGWGTDVPPLDGIAGVDLVNVLEINLALRERFD